MTYKTLIGIEIHGELLTQSKVFCGCKNAFGEEVNTNCCPVCLGLPGTLPVLNEEVLRSAIMAGLATHCQIQRNTKMDRKNYFYPDLPKAYQISQYDLPLCYEGYVEIEKENGEKKKIRLIRIHMEEDTGKSIHDAQGDTLMDFNRCGVPLIEIVSYPDMNSPEEAQLYLEALKEILCFIGVNDGKMEHGSLRCDVNINLVREDGIKSSITELKNLNSFKAAYKAICFEEKRHRQLLEEGKNTVKETRRWDEALEETIAMRSKEAVQDYRYFPEPDIVDIEVSEAYIEEIRRNIPELPAEKRDRFIQEYQIPAYDAQVLTKSSTLAEYYETVAGLSGEPKLASNFIMSEFLRRMGDENMEIGEERFSPEDFAYIIRMTAKEKITMQSAKKVFRAMFEEGADPEEYIQQHQLMQEDNTALVLQLVQEVLKQNPQSIVDFKSGKDRAFGFLVGQVMKAAKGKGNPKIVNQLLQEELGLIDKVSETKRRKKA